ncbi:glutamate dehydrogenase [Escherichia coli]|nr:glutamate dehydrogenase [Escherichia coli]
MDRHRRLTIFKGGEILGAGHRNRGITRDHFLHQAAHRFEAQRQRDHIQQQHFAVRLVTHQNIRLNRRANSDDFIRVDRSQRWTTEKFAYSFTHQRHASRTAHHHHFQHFISFYARIFQRATTSQ